MKRIIREEIVSDYMKVRMNDPFPYELADSLVNKKLEEIQKHYVVHQIVEYKIVEDWVHDKWTAILVFLVSDR